MLGFRPMIRRCLLLGTLAACSAAGLHAQEPAQPDAAAPPKKKRTVGKIDVAGAYSEGPASPGLFGDLQETLGTALDRVDRAAEDKDVASLFLALRNPTLGGSAVTAWHQALDRFKKKGKKVTVWFDDADNLDYLLATAADEVVIAESGTLMLVGVRAEVMFYKNLFEKLDVQGEMLRVGAYKSAAEPYTRDSMSPEFREELTAVIDDRFEWMVSTIAERRGLTPDQVRAAIDRGPLLAREALELKLVDRIAYEDEVETGLQQAPEGTSVTIAAHYGKKKLDTDFSGLTGMVKMMNLLMGIEEPRRRSSADKIAVIYAVGPIMTGKSSFDLLSGEATMGAETMVKAIRQAREDKSVKAIVMRVDSPGGSALASDLIWREIERCEKPFAVSMGDVAGSGGYYISMNADRIFADANTITGSIGVLGGKVAFNGLLRKIGITTDVVGRGRNAGLLTSADPFTPSERAAMEKMLAGIYDQFTGKAAQGRKMPLEELQKLAGGRIYSGTDALKVGLVDEIGTLDDAIAWARDKGGLPADKKVEKLILPKAASPLESLLGPIDEEARAAAAVRRALLELSPEFAPLIEHLSVLRLLARERRLVLMPFRIDLR